MNESIECNADPWLHASDTRHVEYIGEFNSVDRYSSSARVMPIAPQVVVKQSMRIGACL
jgi:hypothetical protein